MSNTTALIVHELMCEPERFVESQNNMVSNGYYQVSLNGTRFGMGAASYEATSEEREVLQKAIEAWKSSTGWSPKTPTGAEVSHADTGRRIVSPEVFLRGAYEIFAKQVRGHHKSFIVHKDATVLSSGIQNAIMALDSAIMPVEKIEGKKKDQGGEQAGSA